MAKYTFGLMVGIIGTNGIWLSYLLEGPFMILTLAAMAATIAVSFMHWDK